MSEIIFEGTMKRLYRVVDSLKSEIAGFDHLKSITTACFIQHHSFDENKVSVVRGFQNDVSYTKLHVYLAGNSLDSLLLRVLTETMKGTPDIEYDLTDCGEIEAVLFTYILDHG